MMKKSIFYLSIIVLLNSCLAVFYKPTSNPAPLFEEVGDVSAEISVTPTFQINGNAGVAVHDNIGLYAGGSIFNQQTTFTSTSLEQKVNSKINQYFLGAGYYLNKKQEKNFRFEIFGEFNGGSFNNTFTNADSNNFANIFKGNYRKISIMPHFGYVNNDGKFSVSYSIKLGQLAFYNDSRVGTFWNSEYHDRYKNKTNFNMVEHDLTIKAGGEKVKFLFQLGLSQAIGAIEIENSVPGYRLYSNFGMAFNFNYLQNRD